MSRSIYPTLTYDNAAQAIEFLVNAFGFEKVMVVPGDGDAVAHAELRFGDGMIMLGSARDDASGVRHRAEIAGVAVVIEDHLPIQLLQLIHERSPRPS